MQLLNNQIRLSMTFTTFLIALTVTSGCNVQETEVKPVTQVVAIVNGDEITVHQINNVLARNPNITPEAADQVKRQILDRLVDQQLAVQKSLENKLDRSPKVIQALEAAKGEILAKAYLAQIAAAIPQPQSWEIQQYFAEHPELFAQRRLYDMEEFVFDADESIGAQLRAHLSDGRSMTEIARWLRSNGVNYVATHGVRAAEQISLQILPKIQAMSVGQVQLFQIEGGRFSIVRLLNAKLDALDEQTATSPIQQYLLNQRTGELLAKEMNRLKSKANIEFVGEFADSAIVPGAEVETKADENTVE